MKYILVFGSVLLVVAAVLYSRPVHPLSPSPIPIKAVYLVRGNGELSSDDLKLHPEIVVTGSFDEFKKYAKQRVALWIDKGAVKLVDKPWLNDEPQAYYPLVLVGYNDPLYSFRDILTLQGFLGPPVDRRTKKLEPGFSVIQGEKTEGSISPFTTGKIFKGYDQKPRVQDILSITNVLLEDRLEPTFFSSSVGVASPTPILPK